MEHPEQWQSYLPFVVIAIIFAIRARRVNRERRMHLGRLAVGPAIILIVAVWLTVTATPDLAGLAIATGGALVGAAGGWQRARFMKIAYDPQSDTFTIKQSPFALVFLIAIMVLRRAVVHLMPVTGHATGAALWPIDGLIGFGLGMVVVYNAELWLRARKIRSETQQLTFS